ncbi:MAG: GDSL-type esterase/lipase family protein, partial [Bacteroidia bacterium]
LAKKNKIRVWLAGMLMPPNYGSQYTKEFARIFSELAKEENVPFLPFLLADVAGKPELNQPDRIHPNELGHAKMAVGIAEFFKRNL